MGKEGKGWVGDTVTGVLSYMAASRSAIMTNDGNLDPGVAHGLSCSSSLPGTVHGPLISHRGWEAPHHRSGDGDIVVGRPGASRKESCLYLSCPVTTPSVYTCVPGGRGRG